MEGIEICVKRNNELTALDMNQFDAVVISPGPGLPNEAGSLMTCISQIPYHLPVLGVCLGMQALALSSGASLYNLKQVRHGISKSCMVNNKTVLFEGLPSNIEVGLYHSWAIRLPQSANSWITTAKDEDQVLMAMQHVSLPRFGVQFHPESIMTIKGKQILLNFIAFVKQVSTKAIIDL